MTHLNIEIKAKLNDADYVRKVLAQHEAVYKGKDHQIDTYFTCTEGRLKLREGNIENNLIHYNRADGLQPKASHVTLYKTEPASNLKALLTNALGIKVVVDKQREIYFIDNIKFHVDEVKNLGYFVEIEAIDLDGSIGEEKLQAQCAQFMELLNVAPSDLIACSYSDLLMEQEKV